MWENPATRKSLLRVQLERSSLPEEKPDFRLHPGVRLFLCPPSNAMKSDIAITQLNNQDIARFWSNVDKSAASGCWTWTLGLNQKGYGRFKANGQSLISHRVAWFIANRCLPGTKDGQRLCVCHACDVRTCCNPSHLFLGTDSDNVRDMDNKGRRSSGLMHSLAMREFYHNGGVNGNAKLSVSDIEVIRTMRIRGASQREIARHFNVTQQCISVLLKRREGFA